MALLSFRAYARHRGVSLKAVQKAIASGRIETVLDDKGKKKIDPEASDSRWEALTDPSKQRQAARAGSDDRESSDAPKSSMAGKPAPLGIEDEDIDAGFIAAPDQALDESETALGERPPNFFISKAMREAYQARLAKLKYLERAGELVEVAKIRSEIFDLTRKTRDAILNVPSRIAAELAAESDVVKVHNVLTEALVRALEDLVNAGRGE